MHFKLVVVFVDDRRTEAVMEAAREAGATGIIVIGTARGEGIESRAAPPGEGALFSAPALAGRAAGRAAARAPRTPA